MKTRILTLGIALSLFACAANNSFTPKTGLVTVHEIDDNGNVIGSWSVDSSTLMLDSAQDTLSAPGIPHVLHSYEIIR